MRIFILGDLFKLASEWSRYTAPVFSGLHFAPLNSTLQLFGLHICSYLFKKSKSGVLNMKNVDWNTYNKALMRRGIVSFWDSDEV